ncbi:MAG TPA: DUF302 domain-containing protein [Anaerolineales bacterium]|nr:DUF302 domain-containing protein [Anaerolineales bacterium]
MADPLSFQVELPDSPELAQERVTEELHAEGFGILTRIDVRATLKEKLGKEFRPYVILGACNPALAYRALSGRPEIGLLLPCNVVVEEHGQGSLVSIINPDAMIRAGDLSADPVMCDVASDARARLERVAAALRSSPV